MNWYTQLSDAEQKHLRETYELAKRNGIIEFVCLDTNFYTAYLTYFFEYMDGLENAKDKR